VWCLKIFEQIFLRHGANSSTSLFNLEVNLTTPLAEFYSVNSHKFSIPKPNSKWTELLANHDVVHVFFGVNTSILDEAAGDYWTLFGTDLSFSGYLAYGNIPEGKQLVKDIGFKWL